MTDQHPITPPLELVREWNEASIGTHFPPYGYSEYIATQAARWGADQELRACCDYMQREDFHGFAKELLAARRPKPPSLAEEALGALEQIDGWAVSNMNHLSIHDDLVTGVEAIRTALEQLKELENTNG